MKITSLTALSYYSIHFILAVILTIHSIQAFTIHPHRNHNYVSFSRQHHNPLRIDTSFSLSSSTKLHLWKRRTNRQPKNDDNDDDNNRNNDNNNNHMNEMDISIQTKSVDDNVDDSNTTQNENNDENKKKKNAFFFARQLLSKKPKNDSITTTTMTSSSSDSTTSTAGPESISISTATTNGDSINSPIITTSPTPDPIPITPKKLSPIEEAQRLRAQAERVRLEAEKMDITLTLQKIEKIEQELQSLSSSSSVNNISIRSGENTKDKKKNEKMEQDQKMNLKNQLQTLTKKLDSYNDGNNIKSTNVSSSTTTATTLSNIQDITTNTPTTQSPPPQQQQLSEEELQQKMTIYKNAPEFMQQLVTQSIYGAEGVTNNSTNIDDSYVKNLILQLYNDEQLYLSQANATTTTTTTSSTKLSLQKEQEPPTFTQEQINEMKERIQSIPQFLKNWMVPESLKNQDVFKNNDTALALYMLEEEYKMGLSSSSSSVNGDDVEDELPEITQEMIDQKVEELKWIPMFMKNNNETEFAIEMIKVELRVEMQEKKKQKNKSRDENQQERELGDGLWNIRKSGDDSTDNDEKKDVTSDQTSTLFGSGSQMPMSDKDNMVTSLFPKSTRKEGLEPTMDQIDKVIKEVLTKDNTWICQSKPEKVPGGYILRGSTKYESGNNLIQAIDKNLQKVSSLKDQISIFYVFDPTPVTDDQREQGERPPVLYVTGANVTREPMQFQLSTVTALGLATMWFNALYPFLLNDKIFKAVDEQLALSDANMSPNLDFLNEMAVPLFVYAIVIQLCHEIAHKLVAQANGMKISTVPTIVPSIVSGLSGTVTSLKEPPRDKQALFDFAIVGPLTGMIISIVLLCTGLSMTASLDQASYDMLPALPVVFLRQSSLGGGIIDAFLPGILENREALTSNPSSVNSFAGLTVPLHPLAIAGYTGMMVNAINLLPFGRTDGGRISLTLFGRSGSQLVSFLTSVSIFIQGIIGGSDLLLFFFSYVVFFQNELEIPQRNEVDDMDFSRALLATATGVLVLLTLIPM